MPSPFPNAVPGQVPKVAPEAASPDAPDSTEEPGSPDASHASVGQVWSLDVTGLDPCRLAGEPGLQSVGQLFDAIVAAADLHPVASPIWHLFGGEHAGLTGIVALSESHLACHTFPEHGGMTLDLYTCVSRPELPWEALFREHLGAARASDGVIRVRLRTFQRTLADDAVSSPGASVGRSAP